MRVLLDSHALIWYVDQDKLLSLASNLIHIGTSATIVSNRDATPFERRTAVGARDSTNVADHGRVNT